MAQALRNAWHLGGEPIQNLVKVLEKHSIVIMKFDFKTDKLDAFFMPLPCNVICIALNANPAFSADRQNFSLAHELGHALMHQEQVQDDSLEKEADAFASEFLFPAQAVEEEYKAGLSFSLLKALKQKWRISMQAILFRGHKLKWIDDKTYRRFYIYFSSQGLRKHEPPCGVENDQPTLLNNLMKEYMQMPGSVLKKLHLSSRCFSMRYPEIQQGGKST